MRHTTILWLFMAVLLATSCVGQTPTPEVRVEQEIVKETVVVQEIVEVEKEVLVTPTPAEEVVKIEFWHHTIIPEAVAYLDELIAQWNKENPTIQVEATAIRPLTEERIKFISAVSVGEAPDIVYFSAPYLPELADMGALAPLEDLFPKEFIDQYTEAINTLHTYNGSLYALPFEGPTWGMFYRKDLFVEAGLDPEKPPATWEELLDYAQKLTKKDASGNIVQYGFAFPAKAHESYEYWLPFIYQAGGQMAVYDSETMKWRSTLDSPEVKRATEFWASLAREEGVMPDPETLVGMNWEGAAQGLVAGEYAMILDGMWAASTIQGALPEEAWGTALNPAGPVGRSTLGFSVSLSVANQSKHKEDVARFLMWLLSPEHHNKYATLTTTMSWRKDFLETDYAKDPKTQAFVEGTKYAVAPPGTNFWGIYRDKALAPTLHQILLGQLTVDEGLQVLHEEFIKLHE